VRSHVVFKFVFQLVFYLDLLYSKSIINSTARLIQTMPKNLLSSDAKNLDQVSQFHSQGAIGLSLFSTTNMSFRNWGSMPQVWASEDKGIFHRSRLYNVPTSLNSLKTHTPEPSHIKFKSLCLQVWGSFRFKICPQVLRILPQLYHKSEHSSPQVWIYVYYTYEEMSSIVPNISAQF